MASQNPGDKSTELSVRTQDLLEEASQDDEDDQNDDDDIDDDLSEQMSYDGEGDALAYNESSALGPFSDDEGGADADDDLVFFEEDDVDADVDVSVSVSPSAQVSEDEDEEDREEDDDDSSGGRRNGMIGEDEDENENGDVDSDRPRDYRNGNDAHTTLRDLIDVYSQRNQVSFEQYERSLQQLHTKWENVYEQTMFDHEQQIDNAEQERQEVELHIEELRRQHENDLEDSKAAVMEQSQKIILEEMKLNADLDVKMVKSEETYEFHIQNAIEENERKMNEEFEIALSGMTTAQEEMKARYEKLVEETKIRVRHDVQTEIKDKYDREMASFKDSYDDLKAQLLEQTMQIQTLEMNSDKSAETDTLISSLENEISVLQKSSEEAKTQYEKDVDKMRSEYAKEMESMKSKIAAAITPQSVVVAVAKAREETRQDMTEEFDIVLSGMKCTEQELTARYEKMIKETEIQVRDKSYEQARKEADNKVGAFKEQYEEVKVQVLEMAIQIEKLELDVNSKCDEIQQLNVSVESQESLIEEFNKDVDVKIAEIDRLKTELTATKNDIMQKEQLLASKDSEIQGLGIKIKASEEDSKNDKGSLAKDLDENRALVIQLRTEISTKEDLINVLKEKMENIAIKINALTADSESKDSLIQTKDNTIRDLGFIIKSKDQIIMSKESEISNTAELAIQEAIQNCQQEMTKDFETTLAKEQEAKEAIRSNYEDMIEETRTRVRDEVESESKEKYEEIMASFEENCRAELDSKASSDLKIQENAAENERKIKEEFEALLEKEKMAQEEMKGKYEKIVEETKTRVRDEVESESKEKYEEIMASFEENCRAELDSKASSDLKIQENAAENERKIKEEFEALLEKEKMAQEEMKGKYEKIVEETKTNVRDKVHADMKEKYVKKLLALKEAHATKIMDHEKWIEVNLTKRTETDGVINALKNEVDALRKSIQEAKISYEKQIEKIKRDHEIEKSLQKSLAIAIEKDTNGTSPNSIKVSETTSEKSVAGNEKDIKVQRKMHVDFKDEDVKNANMTPFKENTMKNQTPNEKSKLEHSPEHHGISGQLDDAVSPLTMSSPLATPDTKKKRVSSHKTPSSARPGTRSMSGTMIRRSRIPRTVDTKGIRPTRSPEKTSITPTKGAVSKRRVPQAKTERKPSRSTSDSRSAASTPRR